jgi:HlyD family secretion protein
MTSTTNDKMDAFLGRKPKAKRTGLWWLLGGAAVVAIAAAVILPGQLKPKSAAYATAPLERRDLLVTVAATGNLKSTRQIDVGSETSGLLTEVDVDNNSVVTKGQVLARFDTSRLDDSVTQAQATLAQAQAQVESNAAALAKAQDELQRDEEANRLSGGQVPSALELAQARAAVKSAGASVDSARAQVSLAQAQLSTAQTSLAKAVIYSPVSGTVLSRKVEPGQTVAASFQTPVLFTIAEDLSQMRLDVKVDEADIGQVRAGQQATFSVDAYPGVAFPATIERVDVGSDSDSSSIVSYIARLDVNNSSGQLRPGMTATSSIVTDRIRNAFVVPMSAFRFVPPAPTRSGGMSFGPPAGQSGNAQEVQVGRGSRQTIYVTQAGGGLRPLKVTTVAIAGSFAAVEGPDLKPGLKVVTGTLAAHP